MANEDFDNQHDSTPEDLESEQDVSIAVDDSGEAAAASDDAADDAPLSRKDKRALRAARHKIDMLERQLQQNTEISKQTIEELRKSSHRQEQILDHMRPAEKSWRDQQREKLEGALANVKQDDPSTVRHFLDAYMSGLEEVENRTRAEIEQHVSQLQRTQRPSMPSWATPLTAKYPWLEQEQRSVVAIADRLAERDGVDLQRAKPQTAAKYVDLAAARHAQALDLDVVGGNEGAARHPRVDRASGGAGAASATAIPTRMSAQRLQNIKDFARGVSKPYKSDAELVKWYFTEIEPRTA
jgi:hypothetical protein